MLNSPTRAFNTCATNDPSHCFSKLSPKLLTQSSARLSPLRLKFTFVVTKPAAIAWWNCLMKCLLEASNMTALHVVYKTSTPSVKRCTAIAVTYECRLFIIRGGNRTSARIHSPMKNTDLWDTLSRSRSDRYAYIFKVRLKKVTSSVFLVGGFAGYVLLCIYRGIHFFRAATTGHLPTINIIWHFFCDCD